MHLALRGPASGPGAGSPTESVILRMYSAAVWGCRLSHPKVPLTRGGQTQSPGPSGDGMSLTQLNTARTMAPEPWRAQPFMNPTVCAVWWLVLCLSFPLSQPLFSPGPGTFP